MSTGHLHDLIPQLRQALLRGDEPGSKDGELLDRFVGSRDGAALEALVRRHAPMVWGVCLRVLGGHQDAEDAFQATFLVLVRKAASVEPRGMVGNWLYGVAHRTALKARATASRRAARERQMAEMPEPAPAGEDRWADLLPVLDRELSRLPDKFRGVIVLCDLEGKTRTEVAGLTGLPEGTVASRLARARGMLATRLARHVPALSAIALASLLSQGGASACPPALLVASSVKAACLAAAGGAVAGSIPAQVVGLTEGVVRGMLMNKVLKAAAVLLLAGVATGTGLVVAQRGERPGRDGGAVPRAKASAPQSAGAVAGLPKDGAAQEGGPAVKDDPARKELDKLNGLWACIGYEKDGVEHLGKEARRDQYHEELLFVADNATAGRLTLHWTLGRVSSSGAAAYRLHPATAPKGIDLTWQGGGIPEWGKGALPKDRDKAQPCAYSAVGDRLRMCWGEIGSRVRPAQVSTKRGDGRTVVIYQRNTTGFLIGERSVGRSGAGPAPKPAPRSLVPARTLREHGKAVWCVAYHPRGAIIASGGADDSIKLWEPSAAKDPVTLEGHEEWVNAVAFSPDGKTLASGGLDGTIKLWDVTTGKNTATFGPPAGKVYQLTYSPEGKTLASAQGDNVIRLWDVTTGRNAATLKGHTDRVTGVAFSPDGKTLASASHDDTIRLWDVTTGRNAATLKGHAVGVSCVAFSPDGKTLASGSNDETIRLWDVAGRRQRAVMKGRPGPVFSIAFRPDGGSLASGGNDTMVRLWDVADCKEMVVMKGHTGAVMSVAFSPDGETLASAGEDTTVRLWDVPHAEAAGE